MIDEAMARAQAMRAGQSTAATASSAATPAGGSAYGYRSRLWDYFVAGRDHVYGYTTTNTLTDLIGAFLVACVTVYFTVAGYLLYREIALSQ